MLNGSSREAMHVLTCSVFLEVPNLLKQASLCSVAVATEIKFKL